MFCLVVLLALAVRVPLTAQVPEAPAGNNLPDRQRVDAEALRELAHPDQDVQDELAPGDARAGQPAVMTRDQHDAFADAVNLETLRTLAVFDGGRVKILETLAREHVDRITGEATWTDPRTGRTYDPVFTYLDLVFNRHYYFDKPMVYVEVLPLRRQLVAHLPEAERERWLKHRRLSPSLLMQPATRRVLQAKDSDLRYMEARQQVFQAAGAFDGTGARLVMVSPSPGETQWAHVLKLRDTRLASADERAAAAASAGLAVTNPDAARAVDQALHALAGAWRRADAPAANDAIATLADNLPRINPATYPPPWKLNLERIYNATHKFTLGYLAYLVGTVTLLLAFAVGRRWLITTGAVLAVSGFAVHTAGMLVRGVLSGRWPIHNQFESFIAITWFAVAVGLVLMFVRRQWLFGAAAAALGACSLMLANMADIPSNSVGQVAGILDTSNILYVHVNIILCSYALIALGFFISLFYLVVHYFGKPGDPARSGDGGGDASDGGAGMLQFAAAGLGHEPSQGATAAAALPRGRQALLNDLDRAQMIVLQLAFWGLITGIMLGAYWADHAWGRWWGWDPKETWALITWIIYLIAIHVRFGVTRRGLTTAWLSVVGFFVMLWTYWGVNLLLSGLHSYA